MANLGHTMRRPRPGPWQALRNESWDSRYSPLPPPPPPPPLVHIAASFDPLEPVGASENTVSVHRPGDLPPFFFWLWTPAPGRPERLLLI